MTVAGLGTGLLDTEPSEHFPVYSAANFGEVAADRLSPLSWSLVGIPVERAVRRILTRLLPGAGWIGGSRHLFVGYFACKPYHNLSSLCFAARHVPGLDPRAVTRAYFEDAGPVAVPRHPVPVTRQLRSLPRFYQELRRTRLATQHLAGRIVRLEADAADVLRHRGPLGLGTTIHTALSVVDDAWEAHYATTLLLVPMLAVQSGLGRRLVPHWSELEAWVNRPDQLAWQLLAVQSGPDGVPGIDEFLARCGYEVADEQEPWRTFHRARFVPTAEPAPPSSTMDDVLRDPWDLVPLSRPALLPQLTTLLRAGLEQREHTKSLAMRALHVLRLLAPRVARVRGIAPDDWPYLRVGELLDEGLAPARLADTVATRRRACELALDAPMPDLVSGHDRAATTQTPPARTHGEGVYPGRVEGTVVFPHSPPPADPTGPPPQRRVLVCEAADFDIQPLLAGVDAVVTARGSVLSHVAILLRERGMPSVLAHPLARSLRAGQRVRVDGTTGEVTIVNQRH